MEGVPAVLELFGRDLQWTYEKCFDKGCQLVKQAQHNGDAIAHRARKVRRRLRNAKRNFMNTVKACGAVEWWVHDLLLQCQLWACVCLLAVSVSQWVASAVLFPLVGRVLDVPCAMLLAYVLIPMHYCVSVVKGEMPPDQPQRIVLLLLSCVQGLLTGYLCADKQLDFFAPALPLMPAVTGLVAGLAGAKLENNRPLYLLATVGGALALHVAAGAVLQSFGVRWLMWLVCLGAASLVDVQYKMAGATPSNAISSCITVTMHIALHSLMFFLFAHKATTKGASQPTIK